MKVLVTGSKGQLGQELFKMSSKFIFEWVFTDSIMFNLFKLNDIDNFLIVFVLATSKKGGKFIFTNILVVNVFLKAE